MKKVKQDPLSKFQSPLKKMTEEEQKKSMKESKTTLARNIEMSLKRIARNLDILVYLAMIFGIFWTGMKFASNQYTEMIFPALVSALLAVVNYMQDRGTLYESLKDFTKTIIGKSK